MIGGSYTVRSGYLRCRSNVTRVDAPPGIYVSSAETAQHREMRQHENAFHSSARLRRSTSTRTWRKILAISRRRIDESSTLQALKTIRAELFDPTIATHNGRLVKTTGDGFLVEFGSVVDALRNKDAAPQASR